MLYRVVQNCKSGDSFETEWVNNLEDLYSDFMHVVSYSTVREIKNSRIWCEKINPDESNNNEGSDIQSLIIYDKLNEHDDVCVLSYQDALMVIEDYRNEDYDKYYDDDDFDLDSLVNRIRYVVDIEGRR